MYIFSKSTTRKCFYSMIFYIDQKHFPKSINVSRMVWNKHILGGIFFQKSISVPPCLLDSVS